MKVELAHVSTRRAKAQDAAEVLTQDYLSRLRLSVQSELLALPNEAALLAHSGRAAARPAAALLLFDSRGDLVTSEQFAQHVATLRDTGTQRLLFAIGPADGWSPAALARANRTFSFGRITLPHMLARAVAAEQIYRAFTILAGHPYHSGH